VELRVERPAGVLPEHRGDDPLGVDDGDFAADPVAGVGVAFDPSGECGDCGGIGVDTPEPFVYVYARFSRADVRRC